MFSIDDIGDKVNEIIAYLNSNGANIDFLCDHYNTTCEYDGTEICDDCGTLVYGGDGSW